MAEHDDLHELPTSTVEPPHRNRVAAVWIIPILAALVGLGIVFQRIVSEGPTITIVFKSAEGIEAGKTVVKYKEVNIGQVTAIQLSKDFSTVEVQAKIAKSAAGLMVKDAEFWIVRPRIAVGGISGLGTLLSGNYIGFEAGKSSAKQHDFTGLETPPTLISGLAGRQFMLKTAELGSLQVDSPIYFRHLPVGRVVAYELAADGKYVDVKVFVDAPYDQRVKTGTRFWNASGIEVSADANGVNIRTESLAALIAGGIEFETPSFLGDDPLAAENAEFTLHNDRVRAMKQPPAFAKSYVLDFSESLRGLSVGAPVTFLGLPAGEVTSVTLTLDPVTLDVRSRVRIMIYPEQLIARADRPEDAKIAKSFTENSEKHDVLLQRLVEQRGLRGQLQRGSLLTGQLYVALEYFPHAPRATIDWNREVPQLPVVPGALPDIENKLTSIIDKIDRMPLEGIGNKLDGDLASLGLTLENAKKLVGHADVQLLPQLQRSLDGVDRIAAAAERAVNDTDKTLLGPASPAQQDLRDTMQEISLAAKSLRALTDYLEQHPESLVRGKHN